MPVSATVTAEFTVKVMSIVDKSPTPPLSGVRLFVPYANLAEWFIYRAIHRKGDSLFLIDAKSSGVSSSVFKTMASDKQCEVVFENVRVPKLNVLGEEGDGEKILGEINEWGALAHCGFILGLLEQVLKMSVDYAKQRVQFGQPIGRYQAIAFKLCDMATGIEAARALLYRVAWLHDQGNECRKEAPMVKYFCSDLAIRIAEEAMRIHAGAGYLAESAVHRYFRDAILAHTTEGTTEIQKLVIARELGLFG